jgi:type I restriction enzyme, S subunit
MKIVLQRSAFGPIPEGWGVAPLGSLVSLMTNGFVGIAKSHYVQQGKGVTYVQGFNVADGGFNLHGIKQVSLEFHSQHKRSHLRQGDLLTVQTGDIGLSTVVDARLQGSNCHALIISRFRKGMADPRFFMRLFNSSAGRQTLRAIETGTTMKHLNVRDMLDLLVPVPPLTEQAAISDALDEISAQIKLIEQFTAKRQAIRQAMMQQLLTGRTRLPGFEAPWRRVPIGDVLVPRLERNTEAEVLDVLSCTKHHGFVRSLDFFKNQVFSRELGGYRVIHRGDIGYPANHVEEGSIGVQELVDRGLVSPIYVVMAAREGQNTHFLHRLLKLDSCIHEFSRITNSSVNRRGSLRWREFSQIRVLVPSHAEQCAISSVLRDVESDISILQARLAKAKAIKQGMVQELLTGRTRLPVESVS